MGYGQITLARRGVLSGMGTVGAAATLPGAASAVATPAAERRALPVYPSGGKDSLPRPRFRHMDQEEWVVSPAPTPGGGPYARQKILEYSPRQTALVMKLDPGMTVPEHGHLGITTIYVMEGSMTSGGRVCAKGMNIVLDIGHPYGPNVAGPEGCTLYAVIIGDPTVWWTEGSSVFNRPYGKPRFKHESEEQWREMRVQDFSGKRVSVHENWLDFRPRMLAFLGRWDPGMIIARHGHCCINTIFMVEGSMQCGDVLCTKGMHITLDVGTPYGPNVTGPEGCLVYEVMAGDVTPWFADNEGFEALKRARGAVQIAPPPQTMPPGAFCGG